MAVLCRRSEFIRWKVSRASRRHVDASDIFHHTKHYQLLRAQSLSSNSGRVNLDQCRVFENCAPGSLDSTLSGARLMLLSSSQAQLDSP